METPALRLLMAAYFHLDWYDEHQDEWANLNDFLTSESLAAQLPADIDRVLNSFASDDEVHRYLDSLGSCYIAEAERGGYRAWLQEIARRARAHSQSE
jgi:hypothetical protein